MITLEIHTGEVDLMLRRAAQAVADPIPNQDMEEVLDLVQHRILMRTAASRSVRGRFFARYAASTARDRARRGRSEQVTLMDTGRMLAAMTGRVAGGVGQLYFRTPQQGRIAYFLHHGTRHMPARPFFDASKRDSQDAARLIARRMAERLENL